MRAEILRENKAILIWWGVSLIILILSWVGKEGWKLLLVLYLFVYIIIYTKNLIVFMSILFGINYNCSIKEFWPYFFINSFFWAGGIILFYLQYGLDKPFYWGLLVPLVWATIVVAITKLKGNLLATDGRQVFTIKKTK